MNARVRVAERRPAENMVWVRLGDAAEVAAVFSISRRGIDPRSADKAHQSNQSWRTLLTRTTSAHATPTPPRLSGCTPAARSSACLCFSTCLLLPPSTRSMCRLAVHLEYGLTVNGLSLAHAARGWNDSNRPGSRST